MNLLGICAFAVAACCCIMLLRQSKPELTAAAAAIAGCMLLIPVVELLLPLISGIEEISDSSGLSGVFPLLLKALAAALCCEICADLCRDCGESSLASKVELTGKVYILCLSLPLIKQLLEFMRGLLA